MCRVCSKMGTRGWGLYGRGGGVLWVGGRWSMFKVEGDWVGSVVSCVGVWFRSIISTSSVFACPGVRTRIFPAISRIHLLNLTHAPLLFLSTPGFNLPNSHPRYHNVYPTSTETYTHISNFLSYSPTPLPLPFPFPLLSQLPSSLPS